jgi:lysozyme-like protein
MARGGNVRVRFGADTTDLQRGTRKAETSLDRMEKSGSKSLSNLKKASLGAGAALAGGLVLGAKESAEAAIEAEKANKRLEAQLKASGISYKRHEDQIKRVIDAHSRLSGFDDEDLGDSFTNIIRIVGDVDKALELNTIAMDFARAKHMDVAKAGELVGKVAGGNTGILSRYGIQIDKGASSTEALGLLQQKFAGQAEAYGKTTAGSVDRSKVAFENLGETIGSHITPIIARVAEGFSELVRQITLGEGPGGRIRSVFEGIGGAAVTAFSGLRGLVTGFQQGAAGARLLAAALGGVLAAFVAFKTITTVVAGVVALRAAWAGLTAAIAANPIGALAIGITAVVGALGVLSIKTRDASISSRDFNDALRAQADALREVRDIDIDVAQRKANVKSATVAVEQAEKRLKDLRRDGAGALELKQAEADLTQAKVGQKRANRELSRSEEDSTRKKDDAREATAKLTGEERKLNGAIGDQIGDREEEIRGINSSIDAVKQQGVNNDATRKTVEALRKRQRDLRNEINSLKSKKVDVSVKFKLSPAAGSSWGSTGDGVGRAVQSSVQRLAQNNIGSIGFQGLGGGALMGADADLGPFASIGSRFGLSVSSGIRPGAITSSGNQSFHASGDAIDEAGSPAGMLAYFRFLKKNFGARLRELIYTPGGVGIKDGRPFRYTGQVASDHFDHVHVAYTGPFGDGPGRKRGTGDGIGQIRSLWTRAGGSAAAQNTAAAIAMAESSGDPGASNRNSDGSVDRGLWQINSVHGALSTFDRMGNARAAVRISGNGRNWRPWTVFRSGAYKRFLSSAGGGTVGSVVGSAGKPTGYTGRAWGRTPGFGSFSRGAVGNQGTFRKKPVMGIPGGLGADADPFSDIPSGSDFIDRDTALAALTPGTEDDVAAANGAVGFWRQKMREAGLTADPRDDTAAAQGLKGALDALEGLTRATEEANRLKEQDRAIALETVENQRKIIALAGQGDQLKAAVIAMFNGGIGGPVGLGFSVPGYPGSGGVRY